MFMWLKQENLDMGYKLKTGEREMKSPFLQETVVIVALKDWAVRMLKQLGSWHCTRATS